MNFLGEENKALSQKEMFVYIKKLFEGCQHIDEEIVDDEIAFD